MFHADEVFVRITTISAQGTLDAGSALFLGSLSAILSGADIYSTLGQLAAVASELDLLPAPPLRAARLSATIGQSTSAVSLKDVDISIRTTSVLGPGAKGSVANLLAASGLNLNVEVSGDKLSRAIELARAQLPAMPIDTIPAHGPISATVRLTGTAGRRRGAQSALCPAVVHARSSRSIQDAHRIVFRGRASKLVAVGAVTVGHPGIDWRSKTGASVRSGRNSGSERP